MVYVVRLRAALLLGLRCPLLRAAALNDTHRAFEVRRVEVVHLHFRDFAHPVPGNAGDLLRERIAAALLDISRLSSAGPTRAGFS